MPENGAWNVLYLLSSCTSAVLIVYIIMLIVYMNMDA